MMASPRPRSGSRVSRRRAPTETRRRPCETTRRHPRALRIEPARRGRAATRRHLAAPQVPACFRRAFPEDPTRSRACADGGPGAASPVPVAEGARPQPTHTARAGTPLRSAVCGACEERRRKQRRQPRRRRALLPPRARSATHSIGAAPTASWECWRRPERVGSAIARRSRDRRSRAVAATASFRLRVPLRPRPARQSARRPGRPDGDRSLVKLRQSGLAGSLAAGSLQATRLVFLGCSASKRDHHPRRNVCVAGCEAAGPLLQTTLLPDVWRDRHGSIAPRPRRSDQRGRK